MSSRKKRNVLTVAQKVEMLNKINSGANQVALAKAYGVAESVVCRTKKNKATIRQLWEEGHVKVKSRKTAKYDKVDKACSVHESDEEGCGQAVTCLNCK